jgi:hypothetical protein
LGRHRFEKLFSPDEANELIPRLEILIRDLQVQASVLRKRVNDLARFDDKLSDIDLPDVIARYPELQPIAARMSEIASEIEEMGCFLKDVDQGLIDFPFLIDASEADDEDQVVFCAGNMGSRGWSRGMRSTADFRTGILCRGRPNRCLTDMGIFRNLGLHA